MKGGGDAGHRANFGSVKYPVTAKLVSRGASLFFLQQEISHYLDLNGRHLVTAGDELIIRARRSRRRPADGG